MALTISNVTTANSTASGATLDLTGVTAAIGDWLVLAAAADNAGTSGVSATSATITDAAGNTWTRRSETNQTPGGASNDGTTLSIWTCPVTATLTAATITVNFSPNVTSKAATLKKVVPSAGHHVRFDSVGAGVAGSGTAYTSGNVSVPNGWAIFGYTALEHNTFAAADSDTTNGNWSTAQTAVANSGVSATSQGLTGQHKTVNATGNQSYDTSSGATRDYALNYVILFEAIEMALDATEAADTAAFAVSAYHLLALAATEAPDTADFAIESVAHILTLAATEQPDRASFQISPVWPSTLPLPTLQGYGFRPAAAVDRRPMEFGAPRVYRRTKKPTIEVAVMWQLDEDEQELLDGFQTSTLQQGAQWFVIELAFPSGMAVATARFTDKVTMKARGGPRWQTTATLELLTRPMMTDAALTVLLDDAGDPPAWPDDLLPAPTLDSWELTPKPAVARTEDSLPGRPQQRQRSRNSITEVPAAWELSSTEAAIFDGFFHHRGRDGAQWFEFPLVQAGGTVDTMVRFVGDVDWTPRGAGRWAVSAPLEIRERAVMTAAEVANA